jgi:predicted nucleic acid-binding protein
MGQIIPPVALDSMLFIYLLDASNPNFYQLTKKFFLSLETSKTTSLTSSVSLLETLSLSSLESNHAKLEDYTRFFQEMEGLTVYPVSLEICLTAAKLRRQQASLKTPDSIQLATALVHQANCFITNDDRLKNITHLPFPILPITTLHLDATGKAIKK